MGWLDLIDGGRREREDAIRVQVQQLGEEVIKAKVEMSILTGLKDTGPTSSDGSYTTRTKLIEGVSRKYAATDRYGSELVQRIVKIRSAFVMSGGVDARPIDEGDRDSLEMEFIQEFIKQNNLDGAFAQALGDEKVIEGQILVNLSWVEDPNSPFGGYARMDYFSWYSTRYEITYIDGSPSRGMKSATYTGSDGQPVTIPNTYAALMKFNARINDTYGTSDFGGVLTVLDNLSKGLDQWFAMNWLFAHPTPFFETENNEEAVKLMEHLVDQRWKLGQFFAGHAKMDLKSGAGDSGSIEKKITMDIRIASGKTGVPVQFLGFPDLMSNRATADNTMEPVEVIALAEQKVWVTGFQELFDKAIDLFNARADLGSRLLEPGLIEPVMPFITGRQLKMLKEFYMEAQINGQISLETLLSKIPDIKVEDELERLAKEKEAQTEERVGDAVLVAERIEALNAAQAAQGGDEGDGDEE